MLDCHCHLDRYDKPETVASEAGSQEVFVVAVTNLPSHFQTGLPHVRRLPLVRLAVGLHPLAASEHRRERDLFTNCLGLTSFVGEVGLDFSREGINTRSIQLESVRFVVESTAEKSKVLSVHSRGAESATLDILTEFKIPSVIFHWYSGSLSVLDEAIACGHYFSVNPAMIRSRNGQQIIDRIPPNQLLTETDGPYVKIGKTPVRPSGVALVQQYLANVWTTEPTEVQGQVWRNFRHLLHGLRLLEQPPTF